MSREAWLRLAALTVSARRRRRLLRQFGSATALWEAESQAWSAAGLDAALQAQLHAAQRLDVSRDLQRLDALGVDLVPLGDPRYPPLLAALDDAPVVLFVRGRLPEAGQPCVALVGTRRTNAYGQLVAETLGRELGAAGLAVISGLAAGIDGAAHQGALRAGGYTAGVLGSGVDTIYPKHHEALAENVAAAGGLISEFPLGTRPQGWHFPLRNRIIAGMARAVVVVQAPRASGALITARLALEQNREVLAVPGPIHDARHEGCHQLIRDGAVLARGLDDILAAIGLERATPDVFAGAAPDTGLPDGAPQGRVVAPRTPAPPPPTLSASEARLVEALGLVPLGIDDLIDTTGLPTPEVQSALVTLELNGLAERLPGNRFVRKT